MLKILQARLQKYMNHDFQMFKLDLEKAEEPEIKFPTSAGSWKKQESSEKHLFLLYWLCQSLWLCGSQQTGKFLKRRGRLPTPVFWPGEHHGLYSPWGLKVSDTTEWLSHFSHIQGFSVVNDTEIDAFWNSLAFSMIHQMLAIWSVSSAFSIPSLNIWKFSVHVLLKPSLKDFENNLTSMGSECNCVVVWSFFIHH